MLLDKSIESGERNKKQGKKKVEKEEKEENQEEEEEEEERRDTCALGELEGRDLLTWQPGVFWFPSQQTQSCWHHDNTRKTAGALMHNATLIM